MLIICKHVYCTYASICVMRYKLVHLSFIECKLSRQQSDACFRKNIIKSCTHAVIGQLPCLYQAVQTRL